MAIEVGQILQGKIASVTKFGAFVDLGEKKRGLVHISQVSNKFVKDINNVVKVGDEVTVKVLSLGDDGKIGLSIRQADEKNEPQQDFARKSNQPSKPVVSQAIKEAAKEQGFDSLMTNFLKDSQSRLSSLKKNTENKRGGRGGRRK